MNKLMYGAGALSLYVKSWRDCREGWVDNRGDARCILRMNWYVVKPGGVSLRKGENQYCINLGIWEDE